MSLTFDDYTHSIEKYGHQVHVKRAKKKIKPIKKKTESISSRNCFKKSQIDSYLKQLASLTSLCRIKLLALSLKLNSYLFNYLNWVLYICRVSCARVCVGVFASSGGVI